ncbi:hypothetical protein L1D14_07500 [Vibrio tubiashii]|uniref:hypothetical protein n=1 Tax=Vibrio tubiashii TaxID=29498 RepID=UPI001EFCB04C|nr:hypothetical protein [Vibrio tubiashii]MCG9576083.1 hypothetical protein [Vibrio tubiashii]
MPVRKQWTHNELCKKAVSWLKRGHSAGGCGCPNAYSEVASGSNGGEIADAIGIKTADGTETILVEVKVTRGDFLADRKKPFRQQPEMGMGNFRYYMCPENLISVEDLPPKWGLLYIGQRGRIRVVRGHKQDKGGNWYFQSNRDAELGMASIMLAKSGDLEQEKEAVRLNRSLTNKVQQLQKRLNEQEFNDRHEEMIKGLEEMELKPIPRRVD